MLGSEDAKALTLARSARGRISAAEGAAVRDDTGRSYAAATVELPSLSLSALRVAVAMAVSSGATSLEVAVVVTANDTVPDADIAAVRDLGADVPVHIAGPDGSVRATL